MHHADGPRLWQWLAGGAPELNELVAEKQHRAFVDTVRDNVVRPADALHWAKVLAGEIESDTDAEDVLQETGREFLLQALDCLQSAPSGFKGFAKAVSVATGRSGKSLYMPLRAALTGRLHGPEMERLWALLPEAGIERRLRQALDNLKG